MNKSYKSVWNESTGSWVAVSELATGRSKSKRAKTAISKAILTQIAVGGMGLAGASIAMAGDPVKLGTGATVNVADGVAIGTDAEVDADFGANAGKTGGVAIGNQAYATGSGVSIGQNAEAGSDSMAMGDSASATLGGTAIGQNARAFAAQSVALGQNASAGGQGSLALGANAGADYKNSTAIGQGATTDRAESVSVGSATIKRQITNVAAGTADTDATNVSQLKALGAAFDTSGHVTNTFVSYDTSAKDMLTLGGAAGTKITNVANGAVSTASKDAVNGSQLFAVAQSAADAVGGSSTVGADGKITKPVYTVSGKTYTSLDSALTGVATMAGTGGTGGGTDPDAVHYDQTGHTSVTLGAAGTPVKVSNVAAGTSTTDAVNVGQLSTATTGLSDAVSALKFIGISKSTTGDSAVATGTNAVAVGAFAFANATNARATGINSVAIGSGSFANQANTVSIGATNSERRLTNMAAGVNDTDGVNLGQMKDYVDTSVNSLASTNVQSSGLLKSSVRNTGLLGASNGLLGATSTSFTLPDVMAVGLTDKQGQTEALGADSIAMGLNTHSNGDSAVAVGSNTTSAGLASVGVGYGVIVNGAAAAAFGNSASVVSDGGLAMGNNATVQTNSVNGIAIGTQSESAATEAIAIGQSAKSYGVDSIVLGNTAKATGLNSILIGTGSTSTTSAAGSVVIGNGNTVTGANTVVLGSNMVGTGASKKTVSGTNSVVLGDGSDGSLSNVVSIGAAGKERKIVNVAAGTTTTDAVNFGQLTTAIAGVTGGGSSDGVQYDSTTHASVTLGGTGAAVALKNVAAGVNSTDAVNMGQLTQAGIVVDSTGKATNAFVAYDNNTSKDTITLKGTAGTTKITQLTNGALTAASSDAVNGSQLFNTASSAAAAIGGGSTLDPATGKISKPTISVGGTTYTDVAAAVTAAGTAATTALTGSVDAVKYDQAGHTSVTLGGTGAAVKLSNVANGTTTNDAVNFGQLTQLGGLVDSTGKALNAFVAYDNTSMDTITLKGKTTGTTKITQLTNGALTAASSDAVNGSQLFNTASSAAAAIGGGSTLDPATGKISKPTITVGGTTYTDVAAAVTAAGTAATTAGTEAAAAVTAAGNAVQYDQAGHTSVTLGGTGAAVKLTNVANGTTANDAVNFSQLSAMGGKVDSTGKALNAFVAYDDTSMNTITLKGAAGTTKITQLTNGALTAASSDAVNGSQLFNTASTTAAAIGGGAALDPATGKISKPSIQVGSTTFDNLSGAVVAAAALATTGSTEGVVYDSTAHDQVTFGAAGKPVALKNVAAGVTTTDAVNMGQLTAMGILVDSTGKAQNAFVAYDDTSMNTITLKGAAGTTKITKLTNGALTAASSDAVNGSQLFNTASTAAAAIGGGATLDPATGKISKPTITIGGTTYDNLAGATTAAGDAATAATLAAGNAVQYDQAGHTSVTLGGTGAAVKLTNVAAGSKDLDAVNYAQLSALGGKVDSTGKALNAFVAYDDTSMNTITLKGAAGTTKITKLTNGTVSAASTDAVNGSQLYNTALSAATVIGGGSTVDANGKITKPTFTVGTSSYDTIGAAITAAGANSSPDGVMYDSSAHDHVTFGGTGAAVVLSNVANAVKATDAVNLSQLTALGMQVDSTGKALNAFVAYDSAAKGSVTLNAGGAAVSVKNVAAGVADTDAVNVAQLNTAVEGNVQLANNLKYVKFGASSALTANATGTDSTALGGNSFASGKASLALGLNARSTAANSIAIGSGSLANVANTVSVGTATSQRRIVNVGDATDDYDAVNLHQVTDMIDASTAAANAVKSTQMVKGVSRQVVGASATALDWTDVIAVGPSNKQKDIQALGDDAIAVGISTHANGEQSVAMGSNVTAAGDGSVGVGSGVITNGVEATAVGVNASVIADHALALGYNTAAESQNAIAIGSFAAVSAPAVGTSANGIAIGTNALVSGDSSIAIGMKSSVSGANTVVLGNNVKLAKGSNSVVLGNGSDGSQDNVVSVGAAGKERKIVNVADGSSTKDAVNYGQMTAAIAAVGTGGSGGTSLVTQPIAGGDLFVGQAVAGAHINMAGTAGARELVGVANGKSGDSAVNLAQLKPAVDALGGGAKVDATTGAVTGPTYSIQGANKSTVGDALTSLDSGLTTVNTKIAGLGASLVTQDAAGSDIMVASKTDGTHVNFAGTGVASRELINVSAGTTNTSAVNLSQLKPVVDALGGGAAISAAGVVTGPSYSIGGVTKKTVGDAFTAVDTNLSTLNTTVAGITAGGTGLVVQDPATGDITVGALLNGDKVNFAGTAGDRVLTGVADGAITSSSSDAVNGKQIAGISSSFATAIGGGSMMNPDGTVTIPSFTVGGTTVNNVGDAISKLDTNITNNYSDLNTKITNITNSGGVATPNAVAYDSAAKDTLTLGDAAAGTKTKLTNLQDGDISSATSTDAVTGGQLYATNQDVAALQNSVQNIAATGSTSIGVNGTNGADGTPGAAGAAGANGSDAIAMGDTASASGDHSVVIGGGATASGDGTTVIGGNGSATGANSTAIGSNSNATGANSVALGAGSVADRDNSVSVGSEGHERQITNVAAGTQGTDAVNLNQMNSAVGGIARKAYSGIAAATALTMIPDVDANKTLSVGIGGGTFQGYAATAIGGTARITQNIKVRVGAGWSAAGTTVGAGASYQW